MEEPLHDSQTRIIKIRERYNQHIPTYVCLQVSDVTVNSTHSQTSKNCE